jgi:hypothetical protein
MATLKSASEKDYLKEVFGELEAIKAKLIMLRNDLAVFSGREGKLFREHDRHLLEMAEYVDWKLQVLEKGTPFDWKGAGTIVESDVSVRPPENTTGPDFSGGYLGG